MMVERRAEAVQERDVAESRAGGSGCVGVIRHACGSAQESLDFVKEDLRERSDGRRAAGKEVPQSLRHRDHPLSHGRRRDDVIEAEQPALEIAVELLIDGAAAVREAR